MLYEIEQRKSDLTVARFRGLATIPRIHPRPEQLPKDMEQQMEKTSPSTARICPQCLYGGQKIARGCGLAAQNKG